MSYPELPEDADDITTLTKGMRQRLVGEVMKVVVPRPDENAKYHALWLELREHAQFIEKRAYGSVGTKEEYFALLAKDIYQMQKKLKAKPQRKNDDDDPYHMIPMPHELPDFMGLSHEDLHKFYQERPPPGAHRKNPANAKSKITRGFRIRIIDKLGCMLFPAPDPFAYNDGRMNTITKKLKQIESEAYEECTDREDYFNKVSLKAYRHQKALNESGQDYVDKVVKYPVMMFGSEIIDFGGELLPDPLG